MGGFYRYQPRPSSNQSSPVRMSWQGCGHWGHRNRNERGLVAAPQPPVAAAAVCPHWQRALFGGQCSVSNPCSGCAAWNLLSWQCCCTDLCPWWPSSWDFFFSIYLFCAYSQGFELFVRSIFKADEGPKQLSSPCLWFWPWIPDGDSPHHVLEQMWQNDGARWEVLLRKQWYSMPPLASRFAGLRKSQLSKLSEPSGPTWDQILMSLSNQPFPLPLSQCFLSLPLYCRAETCSLKKLSAKPASDFRGFWP